MTVAELIEKGLSELQKNLKILHERVETEFQEGREILEKGVKKGLKGLEDELSDLKAHLEADRPISKHAKAQVDHMIDDVSSLHAKVRKNRKEFAEQLKERLDEAQSTSKVTLKKAAEESQRVLSELETEVRKVVTDVHARLRERKAEMEGEGEE